MSRNYTRDHLKISVVKILQTLGWNSLNTAPLEIITDILGGFMGQITRSTCSYANEFGCALPNLDHVCLAFRDMGISVAELEEYVKNVNFAPAPNPVPEYPTPKEDHLNFLKPGSQEVVTRPVHVHEHLPPMNSLLEGEVEEPEEISENNQVFKKPSDFERHSFYRAEDRSRPTREIRSVMMTTSGFLSPATEGKLPESRTPPVGDNIDLIVEKKISPVVLAKNKMKAIKKIVKRIPKTPHEFDNVDKLFTELDKTKVNIFKKISNVKNDKKDGPKLESPYDVKPKFAHSSHSVAIEPIKPVVPRNRRSEKINTLYFNDDSQSGTLPTPKTPEMISDSPPIVKQKRKRKDSKNIRRMERSKTPKIELPPMVLPNHASPLVPLPFPFNFGGPGLIPTPLTNPLLPPLPFAPMHLYNFGQKPPLSTFHQKLAEPPPPPPPSQEKPADADPEGPPSTKLEKKDKKRNKKDKVNKPEKKKLKEEKNKKDKKRKRNREKELKDRLTFKLKSPSPRPENLESRKLIVKTEEEAVTIRETCPDFAEISALVRGPPKPRPVDPPKAVQPAFIDSYPSSSSDNFVNQTKDAMLKPIPKIRMREMRTEIDVPMIPPTSPSRCVDEEGNEVWMCPSCGSQDDGTPMICCDGCDAWYHWVCAGIQVPPDDGRDWYCRHCLSKKNEDLRSDKQKKKEH